MMNNTKPRAPRVLLWDIETDGLLGDRILCIGYKWLGQEKVHLLRYDAFKNTPWWSDKGMLMAFSEVFAQCDYHVTWYGARFDQPVVEARLIQNELAPLAPKVHVDLWRTARYKFKAGSNRLAAWQDRLGLRDEKTPVKPSVWIAARHGDKTALKYIYEHCIADVAVLEGVFLQLRPWVDKLPHFGMFSGEPDVCTHCGSANIKSEGHYHSTVHRYEKFQCLDCGRWMRHKKGVRAGTIYGAT